jgi:hypothetical protein
MKTMNAHLVLASLLVLLFTSCTVNKTLTNELSFDIKNKDVDQVSYVRFKNGQMLYCQTLELKKGIFTSPHLIGDGWYKIETADVAEYKLNGQLAISEEKLNDKKHASVAIDALPGFAVQIIKGDLNVFHRKYFNGRNAVNRYYLQIGNEGPIMLYNTKEMKELIATHAELSQLPEPPAKDNLLPEYFEKLSNRLNGNTWLTSID